MRMLRQFAGVVILSVNLLNIPPDAGYFAEYALKSARLKVGFGQTIQSVAYGLERRRETGVSAPYFR